MRYPAFGLLQVFVVALVFSGCGIAERRSGLVSDATPGTVSAAAAEPSPSILPPAAGASAKMPGEVQAAADGPHRNALSLNVYGLSYHPDRKTVHRLGLDNEVNPGLGLHYDLDDDARGLTFVEVGTYYDSGKNWAKFASLGYQFKLGERWRMGGALAVFNSRTYNDGIAFISMIPLVTYDFGRFRLNAVYFPKFGHYNEIAAFGFYLGIPFRQ
jgi:hypothetical protein